MKNKIQALVCLFEKFLVASFLFLSFYGTVLASDTKINAGLLSDIWFSKIEIKNDDNISIYCSFQNTSGKSLSGEVSFLVNNKEIDKKYFSVENNHVIKLETPWKSEVGDFDIKIVINSLKIDGEELSVNSLIKKEIIDKIKIKREITVEYIKEIGTNIYKDAVETINKVVEDTNQSLDTIKVVENNNTVGSDENIEEYKYADGIKTLKDEIEVLNNGSVLKNSLSGEVVTDFKNRPLDALLNFAISTLQFILTYWQSSLVVLLITVIYIYFRIY